MEFIVEAFIDLYVKLFNEIFPDLELSAKKTFVLRLLCGLVAACVVLMLFVGIVMLICIENSVVGIVLTCVGGAMFLGHILAFSLLKFAEEKEQTQVDLFLHEDVEPLVEEFDGQTEYCDKSESDETDWREY